MLKKLTMALVIILVLLGAGVFFLKTNLDSIVQSAIQKYGSASTQTTVKLDHVKIALESRQATLGGLSVGSPSGFSADRALYLGNISVQLETKSLAGTGPIVIDDITIEKPQIVYEVNNAGGTNLQTLARNAQAYAATFSNVQPAANPTPTGHPQPARKIIINSLTIRDGQIAISQALLQGRQLSAGLPVIHLTNIGKGTGGATPADVIEKVLTAVTSSATQVASADLEKALGANVKALGNSALTGATSKLKGLLGN